jgi:tetratricopeptide (TPR) repeat protein
MQGSIRYSGEQAQILAELIDPVSGMQLWSDEYRAGINDIFAIRAAITRSIADVLERAPTGVDADGLEHLPTRSAEAFAFYMRAMDVFGSDTYGSRTAAQTFLDQAIALDPGFAHAYAGKGLVYVYSAINSIDSADDESSASSKSHETLAREHIETALRLNVNTDLAHFALAMLDMYSRHWTAAQQAFERAIALTPQHVEFLSRYGWFRACLLRDAAGLEYIEHAVALDPENPRVHELESDTLACAGYREAALAALYRAFELDPTRFMQRLSFALLLSRMGKTTDALAALENLEPLLTDRRVLALPAIALAYAELGRESDARRIFDRFAALTKRQRVGPANWVYAYLAIGDRANALRALEDAARQTGPQPGFLTLMGIRNNSRSLAVLDEPAFVALRATLGSLD